MKFGHQLQQLVQSEPDPALREDYLRYKHLKKQLRTPSPAFPAAVRAELEKVNARFAVETLKLSVDFWRFERQHGDSDSSLASLARSVKEEVLGAPPAVSSQERRLYARARALRRFAEWNSVATFKIVKKWAKKAPAPQKVDDVFVETMKGLPVVTRAFWVVLDDLCKRATMREAPQFGVPSENNDRLVEQYSCPICLDLLHAPVAMTCGHRMCGACLENLRQHNSSGPRAGVRCPVCRLSGVDMAAREMRQLDRFLRRHFPSHWMRRRREGKQFTRDHSTVRTCNANVLLYR